MSGFVKVCATMTFLKAIIVMILTFLLLMPSKGCVAEPVKKVPRDSQSVPAIVEIGGTTSRDPDTRLPQICPYDFGTIDQLKTAELDHSFILINHGSNAVPVTQVQPACGCTHVYLGLDEVARDGVLPHPYLVPANGRVTVRVIVDLAGLIPGDLSKIVWIFTRGAPKPTAELVLKAHLPGLVSFSDNFLNFWSCAGRCNAGSYTRRAI